MDPSDTSYGQVLTEAGSAVFATLFTDDGISIWRWGHDEAPAGTRNGEPNPSNWGSPLAHWSATSCDISKYFGGQTLTFNIELCGE